ncbi:alpha/beta-hydrolase [Athelia psychrophila]|uniref:Alpha/beta-hydrolase n=1 Tax=Athelia psychrophila TaxID=1759441 RepID=A0A166DNE0_9AGAM|nr:alpha/beta-hydrolase [Fibularhizoctonia sp. CBS 109695]
MATATASLPRRWTPRPNHITPDADLPPNTTRHAVPTPAGPLEVLALEPPAGHTHHTHYLVFQHGAFGHAAEWLPWAGALAQAGYACYALSARGHGGSWVPAYAAMWAASRRALVGDALAALAWVRAAEALRRRGGRGRGVGPGEGDADQDYMLARRLVVAHAAVLVAPVPGSGMLRVCAHALRADPLLLARALAHGLHPQTLVPTPARIRRVWFSRELPAAQLDARVRGMPRYEALWWAVPLLVRFADFRRVVGGGQRGREREGRRGAETHQRIMVISGSEDPLTDPLMMRRLSERYRASAGAPGSIEMIANERYDEDRGQGVRSVLVHGGSHCLHNDVQSIADVGVQRLLSFVQQL